MSKSHYTPFHIKNNKIVHSPLPKNMSASPPTILMLDKEDACICKHEVMLVKAKCMKEAWQRQWEEEV